MMAGSHRLAFLAALSLALSLALAVASGSAFGAPEPVDPPYFAARVASGKLPPVTRRLPANPAIAKFDRRGQALGRHGGELKLLMAKAKDIRMMTVYGYARLIGYNAKLEFVPDILASLEIEGNKVFTLHLRKGHRWSDGHPFTAEDFRYYWEDIALNKELSPFGPARILMVDGEAPRFEIIDENTVRYSWSNPNPYFVPALAGASPLFIYRPAHYLMKFHAKYVEPKALKKMVRAAGSRNWAGLHHRRDHQYKQDNPDLPMLQPWVNTTAQPSERFIFKRNPYYHRVDAKGRQLPYIDRVIVNISDTKLIPAKTGAGESDLQGRYLRFDNYTFLKESERRNNFRVRLWRTVKGAQVALFPNLNAADPVWRDVIRDARFRRALSLAIFRHEINQVIYYGLVIEGNNTILPQSPLFRPEYQKMWAAYDPARANALLDEMGLDKRNGDGIRLLPDGRPAEIVVETAGESTEETDVLELIHDGWLAVGVKLYSKPSQREVFRNRIYSGDTIMSVWSGLSNAIPTPDMSPQELAPTTQTQLQWPKWGLHYESGGNSGAAPDLPAVVELANLNRAWQHATDFGERRDIWSRMLKIHADNTFTIGVVSGVLQPVVINNRLRNVPVEGIYNWDPGAYFGMYRPDTFWFAPAKSASAK